jgi:hypothetical protein
MIENAFSPRSRSRACLMVLLTAGLVWPAQVPVNYSEGRIRGFLLLRDTNDNILASGDSTQYAQGGRVTNELVFHFKDGSLHSETTVFSQQRTFRLLSYHLVQKGPAFKHATDWTLNGVTGAFTVHYTEDDGKEKTITEQLKLPEDVANGFVSTLLSDVDPHAQKLTLSMVAATPKPRIVKLQITPEEGDTFSVGNETLKATRYVIHVDIGGVAGVVAPIVGKQPPDVYVWMTTGKAPGFLRSDGPLFEGGPIWKIELASPVWPKGEGTKK